jgi:hypothetical protein
MVDLPTTGIAGISETVTTPDGGALPGGHVPMSPCPPRAADLSGRCSVVPVAWRAMSVGELSSRGERAGRCDYGEHRDGRERNH